jgi:hypothetical protein
MSAEEMVTSYPGGSMLTVWVVPGARRNEIVGFYAGALRVRVTAPPEKGRANKAVIALLEDALHCRLRLAGGAGSRRKRLVAAGVSPEDLISRLGNVGN